ncbi:TPA: pyocin knob domain-containing protein [Pseudomonas aeruginosa]
MAWYSTGTVAVTANSPTVTGTGTQFSSNARVGDAFRGPDGRWYEVTNIASATVLSIKPNYQGATASGQAYAIAPMQGYVKESADRLRQLVDQYGVTLGSLGGWATAATPDAALNALEFTATGKALAKADDQAAGRTALGLGTAATAAVQTSASDTTAGALMAVGAFGLGSLALQTLTNPDSAPATGFYRLNNSTGMPDLTTWSLQHVSRDSATGHAAQKAWSDAGGGAEWRRIRTGAGVWQPWHKQFDTSNILGTVSQSGGAPTGAIIERGSNANGEYVRFADGTQICIVTLLGNGSQQPGTPITLPLPAAFLGNYTTGVSVSWAPHVSDPSVANGVKVAYANGSTLFFTLQDALRTNRLIFTLVGRWF